MATRSPRKASPAAKAKKTKSPAKRKAKAKKSPTKKQAAKDTKAQRIEKLTLLAGKSVDGTDTFLYDPEKLWGTVDDWISAQNLAADACIVLPGVPCGRVTEVFGGEGSGKSTYVDHLIAEVQRRGGVAILADTENARDLAYMRRIGIKVDELIMVQADTIEAVFRAMGYYSQEARKLFPDKPILFVWDSVAGTPTMAELAAAENDSEFRAIAARAIRQGFRQHGAMVGKTKVAVVFVNQIYNKQNAGRGSDVETYGGGGIKFHASIRLELVVRAKLKPRGAGKDDFVAPVGQITSVKSWKNKLAPPLKYKTFFIRYGYGVDNVWTVFDQFKEHKLIEQASTWYNLDPEIFGEFKSWQGGHWGLEDLIRDNPELWKVCVEHYKTIPV